MEQQESPQLPDPKGALPIPDHFRLPFHGKMETPTAVPSPTQRRYHIDTVNKRRRKRIVLGSLASAEIVTLILLVALRATPGTFLALGLGITGALGMLGWALLGHPRKSEDLYSS